MSSPLSSQKMCHWFILRAKASGNLVNPVKLGHLVVLADWWYFQRTGEMLISEVPEAWPQGPVLPSIFHEYKDQSPWELIEFPSRRQPEPECDAEMESFLETIWQRYGKYTARQLTRILTDSQSPWTFAQGRHGMPKKQPIKPENVTLWFSSLSLQS